jgi:hypothetical protein
VSGGVIDSKPVGIVGIRDPGAAHLMRAGLAAELGGQFDQLRQAGGRDRTAPRLQAVRVLTGKRPLNEVEPESRRLTFPGSQRPTSQASASLKAIGALPPARYRTVSSAAFDGANAGPTTAVQVFHLHSPPQRFTRTRIEAKFAPLSRHGAQDRLATA